jgi:sugar lactone lactonase YvrE
MMPKLPEWMPKSNAKRFARVTQTLTYKLWLNKSALIAILFFAAIVGASAQSAIVSGPGTVASFGAAGIGAAATAQTVTFTFSGTGSVGSVAVLTDGAASLDFSDSGTGTCNTNGSGHVYHAGDSCTVMVNFKPTLAGLRHGGAVLLDGSGAAMASALVTGTGNGPMINYLPGTETEIGSGWSAPGNIAVDGAGNVYVADGTQIVKLTVSGNSYTQSTLLNPGVGIGGLAVDGAGNLFAAENDGRLHKYSFHGSSHTDQSIGSGMNNPNGVTIDPAGNVFIADAYNGRVLKEAPKADGTYTQTDILDCGTVGSQSCPSSVAADQSGSLFVTAYNSNTVLKLTPNGSSYDQSEVGGTLFWPSDIVSSSTGILFIADTLHSQAKQLVIRPDGNYQSVVTTSSIDWPWGLAVDAHGNLYISDTYNHRVLKENYWDVPSLKFESSAIGVASADSPKEVNLENIGNDPLLLNVPSSGTNPSVPEGYKINSAYPSSCPLVSSSASASGQVLPGWNCYWAVSYIPTVNTPSPASMDVTDNNLNPPAPGYTTQNISLTGSVALQSTITASLSAQTVADGQMLTVKAHVKGNGAIAPTGPVFFSSLAPVGASLGALNGSATLDANGDAVLTQPVSLIGTFTLTATYQGDGNYLGDTVSGISYTVAPGAPAAIVTTTGASYTQQYGDVQTDPVCVTVTDAEGNNIPHAVITFSSSQLTLTYAPFGGGLCILATPPNALGTYTGTASVAELAQKATFQIQVIGGQLTITVKSPVPSRLYGTPNPAFTYTQTGLVSGDKVTITPGTTATQTSPVGYYPLTATVTGPDAPKYAVTVVPATIYVHPAQLTVAASGYQSTYGQTPAAPSAYTITGFMNGETTSIVSGAPTLSTAVTATSPAGNYLIHIDLGTLSAPNYGFDRNPWAGKVTVLPAPLEATATSLTMKRGDPVPTLTYTLTGFVNGDTQGSAVTGVPKITTGVTSSTPPGVYPIYMNLGSWISPNYRIYKVNGTLTVTP